jgi:nicotinamide-nucleotide amidase
MQAIILSIGDELVLGQTVDTNSAYLSAELVRMGIGTLYHQTVADDRAAIAEAIVLASKKVELVIITGGVGPTDDDLTRDALADAMGAPLVEHAGSVEAIRQMFTRRGRVMHDRNKLQALHPAGSEVIPNTCGTAPGIKARLNRATMYVTPGVPSEMFAMFRLAILPDIQKNTSGGGAGGGRGVILTAKVNTFGAGESTVAEKLGDLMDRKRNPVVGTTVAGGVVSVRVRSEFAQVAEAQRAMDDTFSQIERKLGPIVYGRDNDTLQHSVLHLLKERKQTLATAESCTGGLLGAMLTDIPGSSAAYLGGWVTYANHMKARELGVPAALLERHGAVSQEVVRAMAQGAIEQSGADWSLAITGIAGPDGGTAEKPVGTVWVGLGRKGAATDAFRFDLGGEREIIRDRSAKSALQLLRFALMGVDAGELTFGRRV